MAAIEALGGAFIGAGLAYLFQNHRTRKGYKKIKAAFKIELNRNVEKDTALILAVKEKL